MTCNFFNKIKLPWLTKAKCYLILTEMTKITCNFFNKIKLPWLTKAKCYLILTEMTKMTWNGNPLAYKNFIYF